jgi:peptidoglycan/LPS O-acetylase OafA/YrhL
VTEIEHPKYRPDIDGLRAVAVLLVIGFHAFPKAVPGGFIGVDVFFVISGFLISTLLASAFSKPGASAGSIIGTFYSRRVRRIFPSLITVLVACYGLGLLVMLPGEFKELSMHILGSAAFCLNLMLAGASGYFATGAAQLPLLHVWSLGVEEQFYLVWPLLVWFAVRRRISLAWTAGVLGAVSFAWCLLKTPDSAAGDFFLPQMRFWELSIGSVTAALYSPLRARMARMGPAAAAVLANRLSIAGAVLIALGLAVISDRLNLPDGWSLLPTVGTALLILAGASAWINRRVLSLTGLVGIGLISYPLYLWHWPLLAFARLAAAQGDVPAVKIPVIVLSFVLAVATYRLVETPLRRGGRAFGKTMGLLLAAALVGNLGYYTYARDGFPARFPRLVQDLSNFSYDFAGEWRERSYFLDPAQDERDFRRSADESRKDRPTLYLWGDSHAADLYPGYRARLGERFNVLERTASATPPLLGRDIPRRPNGRRINDFIFDSIRREKPDTVVLSANWCECAWREVGDTIAALQGLGIRRIVVVGPKPQWTGGLPRALFRHIEGHRFEEIPLRLKDGLSAEPARVDAEMGPFCRKLGVAYVSPCAILGGRDGFLTRTGPTADTLVSFDYGHLTRAGSVYLVSRFPGD